MIEKIKQIVRGIGMWVRYGPESLLAGLAGRTRLPKGFWLVLLVSVVMGAVSASLAVVLAYGHINRPKPPAYVESDSEDG